MSDTPEKNMHDSSKVKEYQQVRDLIKLYEEALQNFSNGVALHAQKQQLESNLESNKEDKNKPSFH